MDLSKGTGKWLKPLASDEKRVVSRVEFPQLFWGKGAPTKTFISEPGLYKLIQSSRRPEAKAFDGLGAARKGGLEEGLGVGLVARGVCAPQ